MSRRTIAMTDELHAYLLDHSLREPEVLRRLREETGRLECANMQICPEQGQFMQMLLRLLGARRTIEVGTFTGYSALCTALALPEDGQLIACDVSAEWTAIAQRYWQEAGVADKIDLRLAPALETLDTLLAAGAADPFDFFFFDADKANADNYYERALRLLRPGGLFAGDNAFSGGRVVAPAADDENARHLDALNRKVQADDRVDASLVPVGDGLLLARKR